MLRPGAGSLRASIRRLTRLPASQMATALVARVAAAGAQFVLYLLAARLLDLDAAGTFFLAISVIAVAAAVSRAGYDQVLVRVVSAYLVRNERASARAVALGSYRRVAIVSVVLSVLIALGTLLAASLGGPHALKEVLPIAVVGLTGLTVAVVGGEVIKAASRPGAGLFAAYGIGPMLGAAFLFTFGPGQPLWAAGAAYALGTSIAGIAVFVMTLRVLPADPQSRPVIDWQTITQSRRPLILAAIGALVTNWFPILYLGAASPGRDVAMFSVGLRIANVVGFVIIAANAVVGPRLARLWAAGQLSDLRSSVRVATIMTSGACVGLAGLMLLGSDVILGLFGPAYLDARREVQILMVAQLVSAVASPVSLALIGVGAERGYRTGTLAGALTTIVLSLMLVGPLGSTGSAVATCGAFAAQAVGWLHAYRVWQRATTA